MKKITISILFFLLSISLEANYCIQVLTTNESEKNSVISKASSEEYNKFNAVRVESRGRYLVFRIGDYSRYRDATQDIYELRKINKDAYIRKCDFVKEKALYIKDDLQEREEIPSYYQTKPRAVQKTVKTQHHTQAQVKKLYKKKKELKYETVKTSDTLWGECKKCFVPVYEEESEEDYPELQSQEKPKHTVTKQKKSVIVRKEKPHTKDTFWSDETTVQESAPMKIEKPRPKPKNKFNIDEQFLP